MATRLEAPLRSCLYRARVRHLRLRPVRHRLAYHILMLHLELDELPALGRRLHLLSIPGRNLFAVDARDHGAASLDALASGATAALAFAEGGLASMPPKLSLLCQPRILGRAFDPLSLVLARDVGGLRAVLAQVRNTFGGRHAYLLPAERGPRGGEVGGPACPQRSAEGPIARCAHRVGKAFPVSPFLGGALSYRFDLRQPSASLRMVVDVEDAAGIVMTARVSGRRLALSDRNLLRCLPFYGWQALRVVGGIHVEAAKLAAKGLRPA